MTGGYTSGTMGYETMGYNTMGYGSSGYSYGSSGYGSTGECVPADYCNSDEECCDGYCDPMYGYCV
jgi:hypothetical protein